MRWLESITDSVDVNFSKLQETVEDTGCGSAGKDSSCNVGDLGSIPGLGRSPGDGKGYSLLYSGLENSMDCIVHGVTKSWTRLSDLHFHFHNPWKTGNFNFTY